MKRITKDPHFRDGMMMVAAPGLFRPFSSSYRCEQAFFQIFKTIRKLTLFYSSPFVLKLTQKTQQLHTNTVTHFMERFS